MQNKKLITSKDYINYQKIPKIFLFLNTQEIEEILSQNADSDFLEELLANESIEVLKNSFLTDNLVAKNNQKIYSFVEEKQKNFLIKQFNIDFKDFYDLSLEDNSLERVKELISSKETFFAFRPTIKNDSFQVKPLGIFKYNNHLYLFESSVSTTLKREIIGKFIFNEYVLQDFFKISIDQYLILYLKKEVNKPWDLSFEITSGLPFKSKQLSPINSYCSKLKNINTFFKKTSIPYENSIYKFFINQDFYQQINNNSWEEYKFDYLKFCKDLKALVELQSNQKNKFEFYETALDFIEKTDALIPVENVFYKVLFRNYFENYIFSDKLIPFKQLVAHLMKLKTKDHQEKFLQEIKEFTKYEISETKNKDYFLFEDSKKNFEIFESKKIKIYYDFETISLPFATVYKSKPFSQIVVQMSLIKEIGTKQVVQNFIFDPQNFSTENLKTIIDSLFCDSDSVAYVVYNQSFENTRLKEMAELIREKEYTTKIFQIINNTVDLAQWFIFGNHPHIIHKKLFGYHSIKKIVDILPKQFLEDTGTIDYKNLENCKNGLIAQHLMINRCLFKDDNNKEESIWEKTKEDLVKYCENDVKVMVAIKLYISEILKKDNFFYPVNMYMQIKKPETGIK